MKGLVKQSTDIAANKELQDKLKAELNKAPHPGVIKVNKFAGNSKYVPIGVVQTLLDRLFLSWDWRINDVQVIMNGVMVRGTLTCLNHSGSMIKMDGIGASEFQLRKGATTLSPDTLNSKAIERDVPKAESEAFKNAAKKLGRVFGRSLNRKEDIGYKPDDNLLDNLFNKKQNDE
jgi:hypothetical protein